MIGIDTPVRLRPEDDGLHVSPVYDPNWVDTVFFSFPIPERTTTGYLYIVARPSLGLAHVAVTVWDSNGYMPWEYPFNWVDPYVQLPPDADYRQIELPHGLRLDCLEMMTRYRIQMHHADCEFDFEWDAVMEPQVFSKLRSDDELFSGDVSTAHIDQPGKVTGIMRLRGETMTIDSYGFRDRSWGPRREQPSMSFGYTFGQNSDLAFHIFSAPSTGGDAHTGYIYRDGVAATLVRGTWRITKTDWPIEVTVHAEDALGRELDSHGVATSRFHQAVPSWMIAFARQTRWSVDGTEIWGEDQEFSHLDDYRSRPHPDLALP